MLDFSGWLFDVSGFSPRWHCGSGWEDTPWLGWLHIGSDLGVWSAYFAIPCVLAYFALRRKELPFRKVILLFLAFILACGTTHLMEAIIFWWPAYRLDGVLKLVTALIPWAALFALFRMTPRLMALRSPTELEAEIRQRKASQEIAQKRGREPAGPGSPSRPRPRCDPCPRLERQNHFLEPGRGGHV